METIRWGIIGCGNVTEVKSGPGFAKAPGSALAMVMRRDGRLAEDYARRHGVPRWTASADQLIADPSVDAVYVATPVGSHLEYALQVCAAGKPCYVEKPMARNTAEAEAMVAAFKQAGLALFVAYYRRGLPRFLKVRDLVATGSIGQLTAVSYRYASPVHRRTGDLPWRLKAEESGGGLFMDIGCHTLDIIDYIAGPLSAVQGEAANVASPHAVEDSVAMSFRLQSGGLGTASWNFASDQSDETIVFSGTDGRITTSTFGQEPVRLERGKQTELFDLPNPVHVQQPLIETIVGQLQGSGMCASTGETALRTTRVMDTVLDSYYGGRAEEFWARPESWPGRRNWGQGTMATTHQSPNVRLIDPTGVARVVAGDAVQVVGGSEIPSRLLYLDADGTNGRGKGVYLDILQAGLDRLLAGAIVLAHNSVNCAERLSEYMAFVRDPASCRASVNIDINGLPPPLVITLAMCLPVRAVPTGLR